MELKIVKDGEIVGVKTETVQVSLEEKVKYLTQAVDKLSTIVEALLSANHKLENEIKWIKIDLNKKVTDHSRLGF
jgi:chaperonin cofactor prefoldin